jgi:IMP dehydrogenase
MTVREVLEHHARHRISGLPVLEGKRVVGIVTNRDLRFEENLDQPVKNIMTPRERLVTVKEGASLDEARSLMHRHRLERVLVINGDWELRGLMTGEGHPQVLGAPERLQGPAGPLRVGAAVGVGEGTEERVAALVEAGTDVIVVDTAHGHAQGVLDRVKWVRDLVPPGAGDRRQHRHPSRRQGARRPRRRMA